MTILDVIWGLLGVFLRINTTILLASALEQTLFRRILRITLHITNITHLFFCQCLTTPDRSSPTAPPEGNSS